jgi:hypothetical protein
LYEDNNTTANRLVNSCQPLFETIGAPKGFWFDIQTFKAAFFQDFLTKFNVSWQSSSPHYPKSNGRAEAEIKQIKKLVCGSKTDGRVDPDKLAQALMLFRNAPAAAVDHHQPKAYSPDRFATVFRHTTAPSPTNGNESQRSWNGTNNMIRNGKEKNIFVDFFELNLNRLFLQRG